MKVLTESSTTVELDPLEWFDVEWHTDDGEYQRAHGNHSRPPRRGGPDPARTCGDVDEDGA